MYSVRTAMHMYLIFANYAKIKFEESILKVIKVHSQSVCLFVIYLFEQVEVLAAIYIQLI